MKIFNKAKTTSQQPTDFTFSNTCIQVDMRLSSTSEDSEYEKVDTHTSVSRVSFRAKYEYWKRESLILSHYNVSNANLNDIKFNKENYITFLYEDLLLGDDNIVRLLESIMPEEVKYSSLISKRQARKIWLKILQKQITF